MQILLQITSARGPVECCWVVALLTEMLLADAARNGIAAAVIDEENGSEKGTLTSALIHLDGGNYVSAFAALYIGTIQWIAQSPFRPEHKRKNWFVGVNPISVPTPSGFREQDVRFETMKASGSGGQHVNKTESAVRAIHTPTGFTTIARDERSQTANRKLALERISILVARHEQQQLAKAHKTMWDSHNELVRGNPVRVYAAGILKTSNKI